MSEPTRLPLLDVSPVLEFGSPTPLSTNWMPLHELIVHWMEAQTLLYPIPVAPLLTAVGHALFALSHETRALRLWIQAGPHEQPRCQQVLRHLQETAHHWSRAAFALDTLLPAALDTQALARARQLSRIAHTQQERLWALIAEVQAQHIRADSPGQGDSKRLLAHRASDLLTHTAAAPVLDDPNGERREP